jgi:ATP-dependent exoDNAse (exonuclease V) beta subunit
MSLDTGHWYDRHGNPQHTYENAKGERRKTTLTQARKHIYFQSFTTVAKSVLANEFLAKWKIRQALERAYANRGLNLDLETWIARTQSEAFEQVEDAADRGTATHKAIETWLDSGRVQPEFADEILIVKRFFEENDVEPLKSEKTFAELTLGYGGTIDLVCKIGGKKAVVDFKTRKTKPDVKIVPYETEPMQIAAYFFAEWGYPLDEDCIGCNLYLSTTEPGRFHAEFYDSDKLRYEFEQWELLLRYWQRRKNYFPHLMLEDKQ